MPFLKENSFKTPRSKVIENKAKRQGFRPGVYNTRSNKYVGNYENDKKNVTGASYGRFIRYEGGFKNGKPDGYGVLLLRTPVSNKYTIHYKGFFKNGKREGEGYTKYADGNVYVGNWKNNKKHGFGKMWYNGGTFFAGYWVKGVREGVGILVESNGNRYEGNWKNDKMHGFGRKIFLNFGQLQEGIWENGSCVRSSIVNIPYRTTAEYATRYPIPKLELADYTDNNMFLSQPPLNCDPPSNSKTGAKSKSGNKKIKFRKPVAILKD